MASDVKCRHYDKENGWCKKLSDWSEAMPNIVYCSKSPCVYEEELAPCPFCGGLAQKISFCTAEMVRCVVCGAAVSVEKPIKLESQNSYATNDSLMNQAVKKWNRRAGKHGN